jgi:hypothetical protein
MIVQCSQSMAGIAASIVPGPRVLDEPTDRWLAHP